MPRTPIPHDLVHRPEIVARNAERFDHLCRLAEEVALPIVRDALVRETAATGAAALADEAKHALEALALEAANLEDIDEKPILEALQKSLSETLPVPDEAESHQHAQDLSQVLMSAWLEDLRIAQSKTEMLTLSEYLLPEAPLSGRMWVTQMFIKAKPKLSNSLADTSAAFAVNEKDLATIMSALRLRLFPESRLVDLPFDLVVVGAPDRPTHAMSRGLYDEMFQKIDGLLQHMKTQERAAIETRARKCVAPQSSRQVPKFFTSQGQTALARLSKTLPATQYGYVTQVAAQKPMELANRVRNALIVG